MNRSRGFLLVLALFLTLLISVMGMAFLATQPALRGGAQSGADAALARSLAWAGLEEARMKLAKDQDFPPPGGEEQVRYTYFETVRDLDGASVLGGYEVTVDRTWAAPPGSLMVISVVGLVGPLEDPRCRRELRAELDLSSAREPFRWIQVEDLGCY
ncbi:MAG: hypothetical protein AB1758_05295 [Candidatus Eremiobacterota bacterium]